MIESPSSYGRNCYVANASGNNDRPARTGITRDGGRAFGGAVIEIAISLGILGMQVGGTCPAEQKDKNSAEQGMAGFHRRESFCRRTEYSLVS